MARNQKMLVHVWEGDWGLPSVDLDCLRFMAYAKFAGIEIEVKKSNNPFRSPTGSLPVCYIGREVFTTFEDIHSYAENKNICPDFALTGKQKAEIVAYTNMLKEKLYPALQYIWWIDKKNLAQVTRPWYGKKMSFPFSLYYPNRYMKKAIEMMVALFDDTLEDVEIQSRVYNAAEKCLTALSHRLGDADFMFGNHPTSLDATLYAYIAPLLKTPFPNNTLQNHLKACVNLQKYALRISQRYFQQDLQAYESKRQEESRRNQNTSDLDFPHKTRNQIFAALFAISAMTFYALSTGILQNAIEKTVATDSDLYSTSDGIGNF